MHLLSKNTYKKKKIDTFLISGHFVWETNLQTVNGIIPWTPGKGVGGTEEHVLFLRESHDLLFDATKDYQASHPHGAVCEF